MKKEKETVDGKETEKEVEVVVSPKAVLEGGPNPFSGDFPFASIAAAPLSGENSLIASAHLPADRSPLTLQFA